MGRIWEDQNRYQRWLDVELATTETLSEEGIVPPDAAAKPLIDEATALYQVADELYRSERYKVLPAPGR